MLELLRRFGQWLAIAVALSASACQFGDRLRSDLNDLTDIPGLTAGTGSRSDSVRVYFTTPDRGPNEPNEILSAIVDRIDRTTETLDVCAFELDSKEITDALVRANERHVKIRLVTETDYLHESGVRALEAVGVPVVDDGRPGALMHDKFMVFDRRAVWTGSMNFTENCTKKNNNNAVYIEDRRLADNYSTKFRWMFEQHKFGGLPDPNAKIPNPKIELADGTTVLNLFSTHDRPARRVVVELGEARHTIHFLAFSFTDDAIAREMLAAADAGVEVSGVFETSQASSQYSAIEKLRAAKLDVRRDGNPHNMHHKVIIIDGETVITGSFNFSKSANETNDENLLVIRNRNVAAQYDAEFRRIMKQAK